MAGSIIGSLRAVLGIDTAQFDDGLAKSQGKLASFAKAGQVAGAAAAAAITGAAVAMGVAIKATIDRADELSKASQKFGVGVEQLSRLAYAADLSDVSLDGLGQGLKKLSANMADAASGGTSKAAKAFSQLGIQVTDSTGHLRSSESVMEDVAGRFGTMQDGAGKTALAMAIFGKSGADLIPLLNAGKDGLKAMTDEADALGLTLNQQTAVAAEAFNDNLTRLHAVGEGIVTQITAGLLPGLVSLSDTIVSGAKNAQFMAQVTAVLNGVLRVLSVTGVILGAVFDATFKTVTAVAHAVMQITRGDFSGALATLGQKLDSFDGIGARVAKAWNATGQSVSMAGQKIEKDAAPAIERGAARASKALGKQEKAHKTAADEIERYLATIARADDTAGMTAQQVKILDAQAMALKAIEAGYDGAAAAILRYADSLIQAEQNQKKTVDTSVTFERTADDVQEAWSKSADQIAASFEDVTRTIDDVYYAIKDRDWSRAFDGLMSAIGDVKFAFSSAGTMGDKVSAVAGVANGVGKAIGGKAGKALSGAAMGAQIGMTLGGPWGAVAGAVIGGLSSLLGGKKSNNGAIATITGTTVGLAGNKRTSETSSAATSTANAVVQGQELLKALGVSLSTTVKSIDIGTRDLTHVFLSNGQELRTAVGDSKAAAEAGLRAVLDGATFTSDAQKKLVESMEAAGAGFDDIAATLQAYAAAQDIPKQISDAILQLTDPKAFDVQSLKANQSDRRDGVKAALDAGYITADMFDAVSAQLTKLEGLELDQVLAKYSDAVDSAAERQQAAADAVGKAKDDLKAAYDAQADVLRARAADFTDLAGGLRKFDDSLKAQGSGSASASLSAARAAFQAVAGKTDADSLSKLEGASQAFLEAGKAGARDQTELARINAQVRAAVQSGASSAESQASLAQAQLDALNAQVSGLLQVNTSVLTVAQAINALQGAMVGQQKLSTTNPVTANDNVDYAKYLADNPDLKSSWDAGGVMRSLGVDLASAAKAHYLNTGQFEISAGLRKFATGGGFQVGGMGGTDSKLAQMALTPGEYVNVTKGDSIAAMAGELGALRQDVRALAVSMATQSVQATKLLQRWDGNGLPAVRDVA